MALSAASLSASPASAAEEGPATPTSEVAAALSGAAASKVAQAVDSASTDGDAAVTDGAVDVAVPHDPSEGVQLDLDSATISVQLPMAEEASSAVRLNSGAIAYPSTGEVSNTVVPIDGGAQMLTTITSPDAPTSFAYDITSSAGGMVAVATDGSAVVLAQSGEPLIVVAAPWAVDAEGTPVPTRYESQGTQLIQVVDHTASDFAYPIVADPRFDAGIGWQSILFNKHETQTISSAGLVALGGITAACGAAGPPGVVACGLASAAIGSTAVYANDNGQCVGLSFWGVPPAVGWNPFLHSGADCV